jgi:S-methylmethionine-dependent homocysteine/selenocysteine methylase
MKTEFIQPRFDGARFAEHTLPLEVAKDLAAYETLVVELAKHLYLQDHPGRQRVPKGFDADFHLHLEKVDDGTDVVGGCCRRSGSWSWRKHIF